MQNFIDYLQQQQTCHLSEAETLTAALRTDEAVLEKVRANICGIFLTLAQTPNQDDGFLEKMMEKIPAPWHETLEKAIKHNDFKQETLERVKIAVMAEIKAKYDVMKEGV